MKAAQLYRVRQGRPPQHIERAAYEVQRTLGRKSCHCAGGNPMTTPAPDEKPQLDERMHRILADPRISPTAVRLYGLLLLGHTLQEAAELLGLNRRWAANHERTLVKAGYLVVVREAAAAGNTRSYRFTSPALTAIAS